MQRAKRKKNGVDIGNYHYKTYRAGYVARKEPYSMTLKYRKVRAKKYQV